VNVSALATSARALRRLARSDRLGRLAVIGSARAADALKRELELAPGVRSRVVGRIVDPSLPHD
jgi:hypothetical protein